MRRGTINSHEFVFCMVEKKKCYSGTTRLSVKSHVIVLDLLHFSRRRKFIGYIYINIRAPKILLFISIPIHLNTKHMYTVYQSHPTSLTAGEETRFSSCSSGLGLWLSIHFIQMYFKAFLMFPMF